MKQRTIFILFFVFLFLSDEVNARRGGWSNGGWRSGGYGGVSAKYF